MFELMALAEKNKIAIEYWDFEPPLLAIYWNNGKKAIIGLSRELLNNRALFRCVFAEELGHHFTSAGQSIANQEYTFHKRMTVTRVEYRAMKWAALYLLPLDKLYKAVIKKRLLDPWEMAEHFCVTEQMLLFRLSLPDVCYLFNRFKHLELQA